jgi:ribosome-interacting GTPase 1
VGAPNAGKSQILAALTSAHPEVAPYPFTTHAPQPGMMAWHNVRVQLVDTPPITADYLEGYLPGLIRAADAALLVVDLELDDGLDGADALLNRLEQSKLRLVSQPPAEPANAMLDFQRTLMIANKLDATGAGDRRDVLTELYGDRFEILAVSAKLGTGMESLRDRIYRFLHVIRVYCKPPGKPVERDNPFTAPAGCTVIDIARLVHKDFAEQLKHARIWGTGVYDGQTVGRDHVLHDEDTLELHI